jgi:hypothetical protein
MHFHSVVTSLPEYLNWNNMHNISTSHSLAIKHTTIKHEKFGCHVIDHFHWLKFWGSFTLSHQIVLNDVLKPTSPTVTTLTFWQVSWCSFFVYNASAHANYVVLPESQVNSLFRHTILKILEWRLSSSRQGWRQEGRLRKLLQTVCYEQLEMQNCWRKSYVKNSHLVMEPS